MVVLMNSLTGMEPRNEMARDDDFSRELLTGESKYIR